MHGLHAGAPHGSQRALLQATGAGGTGGRRPCPTARFPCHFACRPTGPEGISTARQAAHALHTRGLLLPIATATLHGMCGGGGALVQLDIRARKAAAESPAQRIDVAPGPPR